jgi:hypothetical protein
MADIRDRHDVVLSRLSLGIDGTSAAAAVDLTRYVDGVLRDACHTCGFPIPSVILSPAVAITGRNVA